MIYSIYTYHFLNPDCIGYMTSDLFRSHASISSRVLFSGIESRYQLAVI